MGIQSLPDPVNKVTAVLTPGIGYLAGHGLSLTMKWHKESSGHRIVERERKNKISMVKSSIKQIKKQIEKAKKENDHQSVIATYEEVLTQFHVALADLMKDQLSSLNAVSITQ